MVINGLEGSGPFSGRADDRSARVMAAGSDPIVDFGPFQLHIHDRKLLFGAEEVHIGGRGMDVLLALAARQGEVVDKRDLMDAAWPTTFVQESNLKVTIAQLRRALRLHAPSEGLIRTVVGRGYWLSAGNEPFVLPSKRPPDDAPASLPPDARLLGRQTEIGQLESLFDANRMLTIVGPGGIGKTALATRFAHLVAAREDCAVAFVDLSRVSGEEYVASSLAGALGIRAEGDSLQSLYSILSTRRMLLVIDTCEHVLQAVSHICDVLLSRTDRVSILATSREVLRARDEKLLWLSPLAIPPANGFESLDPVLEFAAPRLLAMRASEAGTYVPRDRDAHALVRICREVEGSPLAIELVAPRVAWLGAVAALHELEHGLMALRRRDQAGPRRQRTLIDTLRWSYSLLSEPEATTLRALSVFAGAFGADAAVKVAGSGSLGALDIVDALSGLRAKSMISVELHEAETRYRLLDSTRQFAGDLLESQDERAPLLHAHAEWVLDRLGVAVSDRATTPLHRWRAAFAPLIDDFRKAVDWTLRRSTDPLLGIQLVGAGLPLLHELSLNEEIRGNCELALAELRRLGSSDVGLELPLAVGLAAVSTYLSTDPERATALFEQAAALARSSGNAQSECRALGAYASYQLLRGQVGPVADALTAMRAAALRADHRPAIWEEEQLRTQYEIRTCDFSGALARAQRLMGEMRSAAERAVPSFQIHQRLNVETQLAALHWLTGRSGRAVDMAMQAAVHAREAEHGLTIVHCLAQGVVWTLFQCGAYAAVAPHVDTLRDAIYRHGIAAWIPVADTYAAVTEAYLGTSPDPARLRSAFYGVRAGVPQIRHDARFALIADAMLANGQADDAVDVIDHVMNTSAAPWCRSEFLRLQAAVDRQKGRDRSARTLLWAAVRTAQSSGSIAWTLRAATDLAAVLRDHGEQGAALDVLAPVVRQICGRRRQR